MKESTLRIDVFHHTDKCCDNIELLDDVMDSLESIHRKVDIIMADITALNDAVAALEAAEGAAAEELRALVTDVENLTAGEISQEQIDALTERTTNVVNALNNATTSAEDATPGPTPTGPVKPVYTFTEGGVPSEEYSDSGFVTSEGGAELLYFSGDTEGGEPTGAVEGSYVVYTGEAVAKA